MKIAPGTVAAIAVEITGSSADGTEKIFQKRDEQHPFYFLVGQVDMIPLLEDVLIGLSAADVFELDVAMDQAYGPHRAEQMSDLPIDIFRLPDGGFDSAHVAPGKWLNLEDEQGQSHKARVVSVGDMSVRLDFNHPLAGYDLHCSGVVVDVRAATADECAHGHVHGPGGVFH
ncbi:MAG: hypothetical protein FJ344_01580 [Sphingomonadales bacterium]|nr:hypothetical protein [Sphingomonadales bacterium]